GYTTYVVADGLPQNHFRTHHVRAIVADPARPGTVYAAEPVFSLAPSGELVDSSDVLFARSTDHGVTWRATSVAGPNSTRILNDDNDGRKAIGLGGEVISGQALARMAVDAQGNLALIWYDTRRDPADHLLDVFGTVSTDGGQTFSPNS